jgi:hypothetical protein
MSSASCVPPGNCTRYTSVSSAPSVHSLLCSWSWKKGIVAKRLLNAATHLLICFAVSCSLVQFLGNSYVTVICLMPSHAALPTNIWTLHDFWGLQLSLFSCQSLLSLSWRHATTWRRAQQLSVPCVMLVMCVAMTWENWDKNAKKETYKPCKEGFTHLVPSLMWCVVVLSCSVVSE